MKYRLKPVLVDAIQWTGSNLLECKNFTGNKASYEELQNTGSHPIVKITIHTPDGDHSIWKGDYIIKTSNGEVYACKSDIFENKYEKVE